MVGFLGTASNFGSLGLLSQNPVSGGGGSSSFLLTENSFKIILENSSGFLLLEA